tara:strand:- start:449 stop:664 length:216 start_codon:yes stop_codon:yes gene_type:complete
MGDDNYDYMITFESLAEFTILVEAESEEEARELFEEQCEYANGSINFNEMSPGFIEDISQVKITDIHCHGR